MGNRLSYTSASTYKDCGKRYLLKYIYRYKEKVMSSALMFGSAFDDGLNALLKGDKDFKDKFEKSWTKNKDIAIRYTKGDLDLDLLSAEEQLLAKNQASWISLLRKGFLMLEAYERDIIPRIKNVIDVQRKIKIPNEEGDEIIGVVDLIAEWEDGSKIIFDNKSSSVKYSADSVSVSDQLGLYCYALEHHFGTRKAGYIVIDKIIAKDKEKTCKKCGNVSSSSHRTCNKEIEDKRCNGEWNIKITPRATTSVIIQEVPLKMDEKVVKDFDMVNDGIKMGNFAPNFSSCTKVYGKCEFFNLCHNNSDEDLIKDK